MASLPYPRRPLNSFHRTHSKFACASPPTDFTDAHRSFACTGPPTEFTEFTEISGGGYSPTDFTDVHRFFFSASRFCVFREFCGKIVWWLRGYGRMPYPPNLCASVQSVGVFVGGYGIPAIPTQPSEFFPQNHSEFACASPPTVFTDVHRSFWRRRASHRCAQMHTDG